MAVARLGDVTLKIDPSLAPGLQRLEVFGWAHPDADINGLPIAHVDEPDDRLQTDGSRRAGAPDFLLGVVGVDHVVMLADDVRATCSAIERASGSPLRRVKEGERGIQGFFRMGSVILEVVERRLVDPGTGHSGVLWGFVVTVEDLDRVVAHLGPDVIGSPRPAVQHARRIATIRRAAGLGVSLAMMTV